jgi:hypothetical protein
LAVLFFHSQGIYEICQSPGRARLTGYKGLDKADRGYFDAYQAGLFPAFPKVEND